MKAKLRVLHLEDNQNDAELVRKRLISAGLPVEVEAVETRQDFVSALDRGRPDLILAEYVLPAFDGLSALRLARERCPHVPFIFVSGAISEEEATGLLKSGAEDYIFKDRLWRLPPSMEKAVKEAAEKVRRVRAEQERKMTIHFLRLANESTGTRELIRGVVTFFQEQSGCEAVGIRLREGDDYPYFEARGFPKEFVQMENSLCTVDGSGKVLRNGMGNPVLECMCGNVICGRFDPAKPFFTAQGSFWSNCTTELLASTTDGDRQIRTRNRCNGEGYESVALIPLKIGEERIGLVQLNDRRKGAFSAEAIASWERLAGYLAVSFSKFRAEEELKRREEQYRSLFENNLDAVLLASPEGKILAANPGACRLFGQTEEELCNLGRSGLVDPEDAHVARALKERMLTGKFQGELTFVRKDGRKFPGEISSVLFRDRERLTRASIIIRDITERKQAEEALRESEERYRSLFENMLEGFAYCKMLYEDDRPQDFIYVAVNGAFERLTGLKDVVGRKATEVIPGIRESNHELFDIYGDVIATGRPRRFETYSGTFGGWLDIAVYRSGNEHFVAIFDNVTDRKQKEVELRKLNRVFQAKSRSSQALSRAENEMEYLNEVCRIIVEDCDHAMVWIGFAEEDEAKTIRPVAHAGFEEGYLESLKLTWADTQFGRGPVGTTIRTGKPAMVRNTLTDPAFAPWRERAMKLGYAAVIALPLLAEGKAFGSLNIYSRDPDPFSEDEVRLLSDIAADLSYGIGMIRLRAAQAQLELSLEEEKAFTENALNGLKDMFFVFDLEGRFLRWNKALKTISGYSNTEIASMKPRDFFRGGDVDRVAATIRTVVRDGTASVEAVIVTRDGREIPYEFTGSFLKDSKGKPLGICGVGRDITDRRQAQTALAAAAAEWQTSFDAMADGMSIHSADSTIINVNRSLCRLLGRTREEVIGRKCYEVFHGTESPVEGCPLERSKISLRQEATELFAPALNKWIAVSISPVLNDSGSVAKIVHVIRDITERKQAEAALKELSRKTELILNSAAEGTYGVDLEGKVTFMNHAGARMLGYESEELIGRHGHSTWHHSKPDGTPFPAEECSINTLNRKGIRGADESIRFWKKDGTSFSVECASTPMCEGNAPVGSVVIFKDISERIAAEAALKESEEKYRLLVDSSPAGVYKADLKGSFLFVNRALSDIFEFDSPEEMMSENVLMRYKNPEERTVFVDLLKKSGRVRNYELHTLSKTGKAIHLLINATLEGETISGMVLNMTEQKRLEAQLRHSQKMEAIGTLAGGVAHDFNNILNVIMGFGSLALNRIEEAHPATEHLKEVLASAERAANLTQRLLAFSRKQVTEMKPVDLNEVVKGTEKMLSRIIGEDIELITDLAGEELLVMADIGQMEQVLINLASNARDAMPRGGSLAIGTGRRELDNGFVAAHGYGKPGHYALVSFTDTGAGMNEETQKKIFEPFFTTKEIGEGTGLGLPIAYGIIKQHNGFINVYSEVGNGTTFKILMPLLDKSEEPVQEAGVAVSLRGGAETILIAEDDGALRDLSRIILESFGYRVMTAVDGEDAIRVFMEHRDDIHLVILDMIMPKKNGKEAYEEIRNASPTIKALFTSGYTMDLITRRELLTEGMDCIFKPILPKDLLKKVREVLDR